jgi:hypothetical protein
VISSFDSRPFPAEPVLKGAIRSVTHLVLAPDRKSLFLKLKSFPVFFFVFLAIDLVRPSRFSGTRKRSVPVRVHSVYKSFGFVVACYQVPTSNPFLTHGTVESPAKLSSSSLISL